MTQEQLIEAIATFSDYEAAHYLKWWNEATSIEKNKAPIDSGKLINSPNAGSLIRLLLMTIVLEHPDGEKWLSLQILENPFTGDALNFPKENARSVKDDVLQSIMSTLGQFRMEFGFTVKAGKVDFSINAVLGANKYVKQQQQQAIQATPWMVEAPSFVKVGIITPKDLESKAVLEHFKWESMIGTLSKNHYTTGDFEGLHQRYRIINRVSGSGISPTVSAIKSMVYEFSPALIMAVGVAGGVRKIDLGDVIVATKAYGYERGQATSKGINVRPDAYDYTHALVEQCKMLASQGNWKNRIKQKPEFPSLKDPDVVFGRIASGNLVIESIDSEIYERLKEHFNDTAAVEMEAIAFEVLKEHPEVMSLNIRCISDKLQDKQTTDQHNYQDLAAARAAAFTFELLHQMKL